jgi:hypothetical protein
VALALSKLVFGIADQCDHFLLCFWAYSVCDVRIQYNHIIDVPHLKFDSNAEFACQYIYIYIIFAQEMSALPLLTLELNTCVC